MKGQGNLSLRYLKGHVIKIFRTHIPYDWTVLIYRTQHENDRKTFCFSDLLTSGAFLRRLVKGVLFSNGRFPKAVSSLPEMLYKRVSVGPRGGASPFSFFYPLPRILESTVLFGVGQVSFLWRRDANWFPFAAVNFCFHLNYVNTVEYNNAL